MQENQSQIVQTDVLSTEIESNINKVNSKRLDPRFAVTHTPWHLLKPGVLYRHYDGKNKLLYIGISLSVFERMSGHRNSSHWFCRIKKITLEHFAFIRDAKIAETCSIILEKPAFNIAGVIKKFPVHKLNEQDMAKFQEYEDKINENAEFVIKNIKTRSPTTIEKIMSDISKLQIERKLLFRA